MIGCEESVSSGTTAPSGGRCGADPSVRPLFKFS